MKPLIRHMAVRGLFYQRRVTVSCYLCPAEFYLRNFGRYQPRNKRFLLPLAEGCGTLLLYTNHKKGSFPNVGDVVTMEHKPPMRVSVVSVRSVGFIYNAELGRVECMRCGGRAFTRRKDMIELWERAHLQCCRRKDQPLVTVCA